jgi:glycine oxidase
MKHTLDCIVVGGGIIGLFTAWELAATGRRVVLLERGELGQEASWAGAGILSPLRPWDAPLTVDSLVRWSQARYPEIAQDLTRTTGIDPEWTQSGLLLLNTSAPAAAHAWADRTGYRLEPLAPVTLRAREPALATATQPALWIPEVAQIRNPRLLRALRQRLLQRAVDVREHCEVNALAIHGARVTGVKTAQDTIPAEHVIIAAGAWSPALLTGVRATPAIEPVRGQMLLYRPPIPLLSHIVLVDDCYLVPRRDGRILVGSSVEHAGYDAAPTAAVGAALAGFAARYVPALHRGLIERHWAGLRPGSPDGIPTIGPHPDINGLYLNAGHYRYGVLMAPASGRLLADLILDRPPIVDPAPYAWTEPVPQHPDG